MPTVRLFMIALVLISALGCSGRGEVPSTVPADPWLRHPPDEFFSNDTRRDLDKNDFAAVTSDEAKALAKLESSPWVKLTPQEAELLLGHPFPELNGRLVLLRALSLNELNGEYTVTLWSGSVRIHHGSLGGRPIPTKRRALIARLPALPSEVYVDCSMAE